MNVWVKLLLGAGIGAGAGGLMGYFGKCASGACPLTANPLRGALVGLTLGLLAVLSMSSGCAGGGANADDPVPHLTDQAEFDQKVLQADWPVLVDFYSNNCPPCRQLAPDIASLYEEYQGRAGIYKVNVVDSPALVGEYGIRNIPHVILFHEGQKVEEWRGYTGQRRGQFKQRIDSLLNQP